MKENHTNIEFDTEVDNIVVSEIDSIQNNLSNIKIECFTPKDVESGCQSLAGIL